MSSTASVGFGGSGVASAARAAAIPLDDVVLEIDRVRAGADHGVDRGLREKRPTEVGVQHGAGGIHDPLEAVIARRAEPRLDRADDRVGVERRRIKFVAVRRRPAQVIERLAAGAHHVVAIEPEQQTLGSRVREQPAHRRELAQSVVRHCVDGTMDFRRGEGRCPVAPLVFKTSLGAARSPEGSTPSLLRH